MTVHSCQKSTAIETTKDKDVTTALMSLIQSVLTHFRRAVSQNAIRAAQSTACSMNVPHKSLGDLLLEEPTRVSHWETEP